MFKHILHLTQTLQKVKGKILPEEIQGHTIHKDAFDFDIFSDHVGPLIKPSAEQKKTKKNCNIYLEANLDAIISCWLYQLSGTLGESNTQHLLQLLPSLLHLRRQKGSA